VSRLSLELNNWSTRSSSIRPLRANRYDMNSSEKSASLVLTKRPNT
jgi:hypothetical protein